MNTTTILKKILYKELDPAFARRARILIEELNIQPSDSVLEIGCGRGFYEQVLSLLYPKTTITAVDTNQDYLEKARKGVSSNRVNFEIQDALNLTYKQHSFDKVFATEVLEHVDDDVKMLREMKRVLKKGGTAIITVPNSNYPVLWDPLNIFLTKFFHTHVSKDIWWIAGIWADHQRLYSEDELVKKAQKVGFRVEKVWRSTHYCIPFSHFLLYGIGKNIVEKGFLQSFYRFSLSAEPSFLLRCVRAFMYLFDSKNKDTEVKGTSTVNLILKLRT